MILLSMDLSLSQPAFVVMELTKDGLSILHKSSIKTDAKKTHGYRLLQIYNRIDEIINTYESQLDYVVSEKGFSRHARTTQILFMVHGIARLNAFQHGYEVQELSPTTVKKAVSGNGKNSKEQLADAVKGYFPNGITFKNTDESDATAVGVAFLIQKGKLTA
ncbi:crossover junction endodeoxyribonuclease RuvC [Priestia aryabhattai]|uniref:crossover junction endodeoxyribonuclease RuvC n=1 Tax=Priestia aryabhattai TaxID=412384 RepID=UPI0028821EFB|nr:crossover junction endodeoxyribonuclease RuvC [Priestia aryabhattai]MDT0150046.1 crossover junction endodeoxyribonuclease RuvC [Priestia aryabhattai]MDT0155616.1 crossover junction endodeoxyribonuclease RuvC [Priestia aryabhattai]